LRQAGCERLFRDIASGAQTERVGLAEALAFLRPGDLLVVWKLDRLGRSLPHLIESIRQLQDRGIGFRSLHEQLDTTTSGGKLIFPIFGALAEFERDLIRERTQAGLQAARARGRTGGRPTILDARKITRAIAWYQEGKFTSWRSALYCTSPRRRFTAPYQRRSKRRSSGPVKPVPASSSPDQPVVYQFRVSLREISPMVWRRLLVRSEPQQCRPACHAATRLRLERCPPPPLPYARQGLRRLPSGRDRLP